MISVAYLRGHHPSCPQHFKPTTNISPHISDCISWLCLMSESPDTTECLVCLQATPKTRVHYGGVSCYSCRAFFRRNTRSGKNKKCKIDQDCTVSYMEHKQCTPCRYQKGLRSELNIKGVKKQVLSRARRNPII